MEQALTHHIKQQDQIDEFMFCLVCGEIGYLHDRDTYETRTVGVVHKCCAGGQTLGEWFNERVAAGVDPIEAARDADACCMSFENWQEHWQAFYGVPVPR